MSDVKANFIADRGAHLERDEPTRGRRPTRCTVSMSLDERDDIIEIIAVVRSRVSAEGGSVDRLDRLREVIRSGELV